MAQAYKKIGKPNEEKVELQRFQDLRKAEQERGKMPEALGTRNIEEPKAEPAEGFPLDP